MFDNNQYPRVCSANFFFTISWPCVNLWHSKMAIGSVAMDINIRKWQYIDLHSTKYVWFSAIRTKWFDCIEWRLLASNKIHIFCERKPSSWIKGHLCVLRQYLGSESHYIDCWMQIIFSSNILQIYATMKFVYHEHTSKVIIGSSTSIV